MNRSGKLDCFDITLIIHSQYTMIMMIITHIWYSHHIILFVLLLLLVTDIHKHFSIVAVIVVIGRSGYTMAYFLVFLSSDRTRETIMSKLLHWDKCFVF
ncbi:hypothetical protein BDA99DRAFT_507166 [Phascolomyces articulosus]|uniref:Uncharacterized protein n=1 Tax=Phascolomyces articulosus TaxID=60185 RepID=A0AAD5PEQ6_9FUNG|nr:hypothetical protein BDA99DRAFT_507166 [Phascolomyces articulosus]